MRTIQCNFSEQNFPLRQSFQTESVPFLVKTTRRDAYCVHDPENDVFKIMEWGECGGGAIDVPGVTMRRALNSPLADDANRLMDVALAAQVVSFVCYINEYRGRGSTNLSRITGGPIIDTPRLLEAIDVSAMNRGAADQALLFPTGFMMGDPNSPTPITIAVWPCPEAIPEGELPDTPDLQLISHGVQAEKAYPISFQVDSRTHACTHAHAHGGGARRLTHLGVPPAGPRGSGRMEGLLQRVEAIHEPEGLRRQHGGKRRGSREVHEEEVGCTGGRAAPAAGGPNQETEEVRAKVALACELLSINTTETHRL